MRAEVCEKIDLKVASLILNHALQGFKAEIVSESRRNLDKQLFDMVKVGHIKQHASLELRRAPLGYLESAFARGWHHWNTKDSGQPILATLCERYLASPLTKREKAIAATVVQWLGTNVGLSFMREVLESRGYYIGQSKRGDWLQEQFNERVWQPLYPYPYYPSEDAVRLLELVYKEKTAIYGTFEDGAMEQLERHGYVKLSNWIFNRRGEGRRHKAALVTLKGYAAIAEHKAREQRRLKKRTHKMMYARW